MKSIVYNLLIALAILIAMPAFAQKKNDDFLLRSVKDLQVKLNLTDSVAGQVLTVFTNWKHQRQEMGTNINAADRKIKMRKISATCYAQLKSLLTPQQWSLYQQIEAANLEKFRNQMNAKKIPVKKIE